MPAPCLTSCPRRRPTPSALLQNPALSHDFVRAMDFLDEIMLRSEEEKKAFFLALPPQLDTFPRSVCVRRILPAVRDELQRAGSAGKAGGAHVLPCLIHLGTLLYAHARASVCVCALSGCVRARPQARC